MCGSQPGDTEVPPTIKVIGGFGMRTSVLFGEGRFLHLIAAEHCILIPMAVYSCMVNNEVHLK